MTFDATMYAILAVSLLLNLGLISFWWNYTFRRARKAWYIFRG